MGDSPQVFSLYQLMLDVLFLRADVEMLSCFPAPRGSSGTEAGFCHRVTLDKRSTVSLFGDDISPIVMDVEFQTKDRLRFKVSITGTMPLQGQPHTS